MRVLGVSIAAGILYLATLSSSERTGGPFGVPDSDPRRIVPSESLPDELRILDVRDRVRQDLRSIRPDAVALVATRQFAGLRYKVALGRITIHSAVMIACAEEDVPFSEVKTEDVGRLAGVPAKSLSSIPYSLFGYSAQPKYWKSGLSDAYGGAAYKLDALSAKAD